MLRNRLTPNRSPMIDLNTAGKLMTQMLPYLATPAPVTYYEIPPEIVPESSKHVPLTPAKKSLPSLHQALAEFPTCFKDISTSDPAWELVLAGFGVYREIQRLIHLKKLPMAKKILFDILAHTKTLVTCDDEDPFIIKRTISEYHELINDISPLSVGKALAGAMLCLLAVAVIAACSVFALAAFGVFAPLTLVGVTIGASLWAGVAGMIAAPLLGGALQLAGSHLIFKSLEKSKLQMEMSELELMAKKTLG